MTMYDTPTFRGGGIEGRGPSESYQTPHDELGHTISNFGGFGFHETGEESYTFNPNYSIPQPTYPQNEGFVSQLFGAPAPAYTSYPMPEYQGGTYGYGYNYGQHYRPPLYDSDEDSEEPSRNSMWL
eukprot:TRINITY_DN1151_c0_g1_i3.p1 TRINITY_DN1151_c0_g1~~TRINITY_DN1151_c0_g1_i3.p1  ORF type:complete len:126 (-),score=14.00 TRINITY_DN1151_c0_g1_i3:314-691(-)